MSTTLELKIRIRELEARVKELEDRRYIPATSHTPPVEKSEVNFGVDFGVEPAIVGVENAAPQVSLQGESTTADREPVGAAPKYKLCPKCGVKPAYFFHVRSCGGKQKEEKTHGDDGNRSTGGS
jgi:hypothetical protein